jgi:hypothetical protein
MAKRTIRRRVRKSKTIRKVMRGCNGRRGGRGHSRVKVGGAAAGNVEAAQYAGAPPQANENLAGGTAAFLEAQQMAGNSPPVAPVKIVNSNMTQLPQQGGARTRRHHRRRLRYKKSMARKSRRA